jgi:uncharacterized membrane protein
VDNHEFAPIDYTLRADLVGIQVTNASGNGTIVEVNRTEWSRIQFRIDHGGTWTWIYSFSIPYAAMWKVQFLLFLGSDGNATDPYRRVHLLVNVTAPGPAPPVRAVEGDVGHDVIVDLTSGPSGVVGVPRGRR